ncbi:MAG: NADH-quinone oxidoreductase subunit NuoG [Gammaproteobacteria bacterium]|nr:NADH-quinone oxidoreductase subunit NuoG [Gammaproteobacteria bacterium]MDE2022861.1 NADH-quinone oxidoreductase subunit G [Gammaproteobacteria bacterium]
MADAFVNIEIDGKPIKAHKGEMIIRAADREGIYIPRFCYHEKLSVAANCRMCLVEVEKAPKPLVACATPVAEGMKVFTRSQRALDAQRGTMEFLLINHPLDCPICDQGGECELQDLSMGYGRHIGRFSERKRAVKDNDIGPLIQTFMTRCIYCTRCIRFLQEIGGVQELGDTGRGEHSLVGTYVARSVDSELSGNVIDICPVGALNSKPFKMRGRGWEMTQIEGVSPHDCVGSNLYGHVLRGKVMRVVSRANEAVNEAWISDRDRFSYTGIDSQERLLRPRIRQDGAWRETDWQTALGAAATALQTVRGDAAALASPNSTLEELYLLQKLVRALGIHSVDTRLRQADFRDDEFEPLFPWLGQSLEDLVQLDAALIIGSNTRKEAPMLAHRLRMAAMRGNPAGSDSYTYQLMAHTEQLAGAHGAAVMFLNPRAYEFLFPMATYLNAGSRGMLANLAAILKAALQGGAVPTHLQDIVKAQKPTEVQKAIAAKLREDGRKSVLLGHLALQHPHYADLRALAAALAQATGAQLGYISEGANSTGAWLAGAVPHRLPGGKSAAIRGLDAAGMFAQPRRAYLLMGVEPELDCWDGAHAVAALKSASAVVSVTPYVTERMLGYASVLLPAATFGETSGTVVNAEGRWQSFTGMVKPLGEARPAWKVLRVLGNTCAVDGFGYQSSEEVRDELKAQLGEIKPDNSFRGSRIVSAQEPATSGLQGFAEVPLYATDMLVRRAEPLQQTRDADAAWLRLSPEDAEKLKLADGARAKVKYNGSTLMLPVKLDAGVHSGEAVWPAGIAATAAFAPLTAAVTVEKA